MGSLEIHPNCRLMKLLRMVIREPILNLIPAPGSKPGDNVVGQMVSIQLETKSRGKETLVIKGVLPYGIQDAVITTRDKMVAMAMTELKVFSTELSFFKRILPELEANFPSYPPLPTPEFFYGVDDVEHNGVDAVIVLEDLRPKGYRMADKITGLAIEEVTLVLGEIARFHAVSFVYLQTHQKELLELLKNDPESLKDDPLSLHVFSKPFKKAPLEATEFMCRTNLALINHAKEIGAISAELHDKIIKFQANPLKTVLDESRQAGNDFFRTVIHGDLWANNILLKYDDIEPRKPVAVQFIDFQQCRYASIFDELHYFFYTSTTAEFRGKNLKTCLDSYYDTFISSLDQLEGPKPEGFSKEEFHNGYRKYLGSAFSYAVFAIPFQVGEPPSSPPETEEIQKSEDKTEEAGENDDLSDEKLVKFVVEKLPGIRSDLVAAAKNSSVAICRLTELCIEMNEWGLFDDKN